MTPKGADMRTILHTVLFYACLLLPFAAGLLAYRIGAPWWVSIIVVLALLRYVAQGLTGNTNDD